MLRTAPMWLALGFALPATALAHPQVDEGIRRLQEADFDGALTAFAAAERRDDLTREDLLALLEARAAVHLALNDQLSADADLRMLAALDPDHRLGDAASPDLVAAFERAAPALREGVSISAAHTRSDDRVQIDTWIRSDPAGLVREIRVLARRGEEPWREPSIAQASVPASADVRVAYYAQAIGPGGAVVATFGTADRPRVAAGGQDEPAAGVPWLWIGVGVGAAVVATTIAVVLVASSGGTNTVIEGPYPTD